MGWKAVKEHYRIKHSVCVTSEGMCIGSAYIHNIIVISPEGKIVKRYKDGFSRNDDLHRYQTEMDADPGKLREFVAMADSFSKSLPVYTYEGDTIIEKRCEEYGWPNVTHDGQMMYENTFSPDKKLVVKWAKENAMAGIRLCKRRIDDAAAALAAMQTELAASHAGLSKLESDYPS